MAHPTGIIGEDPKGIPNSKLSSLSKTAIKGITGNSPRAWFLIEQGNTSLFYVDKKLSSAEKLKDPAKCKVLLEKLRIEGIEDIGAKSPLICGVVARKGRTRATAPTSH